MLIAFTYLAGAANLKEVCFTHQPNRQDGAAEKTQLGHYQRTRRFRSFLLFCFGLHQ
jgi:hypothetical protein